MSRFQPSVSLTLAIRTRAIKALVPFLLQAPGTQEADVYQAAEAVLRDYNAATPRELQLATQIIALGLVSLACLSASMTVKDESLEAMLDFQDDALALIRLSEKAWKALQTAQRVREKNPASQTADSTCWDEAAFQSVIGKAKTKMEVANIKVTAFLAARNVERNLEPMIAPRMNFLFAEPMTSSVLSRLKLS